MCCSKAALSFILNGPPAAQAPASPAPATPFNSAPSSPAAPQMQPRNSTITSCDPENRTAAKRLTAFSKLTICDLLSPEPTAAAAATVPKRRKIVNCQVPGCKSRALTRKLCMRHGGGSRCQYPDCTNGAKLRNLCFQHGGSTTCLAPECDNVAKRFGYCWTHGGAYVCSAPNCKKFAAQGGLCWAHGGGNRCGHEGCTKRSYKQYDYRCKEHANAPKSL